MKAAIEAINRMQADGIIDKYAIGGAVGATFYLEPAATLDVDVFVILPTAPGGLLLSLSPIYDYWKARGGTVEDEYIVISGWPVQFLPANNELELEALAEAVPTTVEDVGTWVLTAEHLAAIAFAHGTSQGSQPHPTVYRGRRGRQEKAANYRRTSPSKRKVEAVRAQILGRHAWINQKCAHGLHRLALRKKLRYWKNCAIETA